jgi:hypothetical protein
MDEDDFDSSDIEFEPPSPNAFINAGRASIATVVEHAGEDRLTSKKSCKQLAFVAASKKTEYMTHLWYARFVAYSTFALKKR